MPEEVMRRMGSVPRLFHPLLYPCHCSCLLSFHYCYRWRCQFFISVIFLHFHLSSQGDRGTLGSAHTSKTSFSEMTQVIWCHPICWGGHYNARIWEETIITIIWWHCCETSRDSLKPMHLPNLCNPRVSPSVCIVLSFLFLWIIAHSINIWSTFLWVWRHCCPIV